MPTKAKLTDTERLELLRRVLKGENRYRLAEEYGISRGRIYQMLDGLKDRRETWDADTKYEYELKKEIGALLKKF